MLKTIMHKSGGICHHSVTIPASFAKCLLLSACLFPVFTSNASAFNTTKTGIPLDADWKQKVYDFALINVKHSAWGIAHSERDYQVSLVLAAEENMMIDKDVIFAAAFLHDLGAIEPYRKKEVEHSIRSVELVEPLLASYGFPMQKWPSVQAAILGHMYYAEKPAEAEAILFHDADALDFLGTIGMVRLVSVTERHQWAPDLTGGFQTLQQFKHDMSATLITKSAQRMAEQRIGEFDRFMVTLNQETWDGRAL